MSRPATDDGRVAKPIPSGNGFTLLELLVVIAIIGVLVALLLPAVQAAREAARRTHCSNNLKQLDLGLHSYHFAHASFPPGGYANPSGLGWPVTILPHIEQSPLFEKFDFSKSHEQAPNLAMCLTPVAAFLCPSQPSRFSEFKLFGATNELVNGQDTYTIHYAGVAGPTGMNIVDGQNYPEDPAGTCGGLAQGGILYVKSAITFAHIRDGSSNTFLLGEFSKSGSKALRVWSRGCRSDSSCPNCASCRNVEHGIGVFGYSVYAGEFNDVSFGSNHPSGAHFGMADGSVRFLNETIDLVAYKALASRSGGEVAVP